MTACVKPGVRMHLRTPALTILLSLLSLFSMPVAAQTATCPTYASEVQVGEIDDGSPLIEISGMVASRQSPGVFWIHNDGGNPNHVYAINEAGETLATYSLSGATNRDWEDIAIGPGPTSGQDYLYVGDIGNNNLSRSSIDVYRVAEPFVDPNKTPVPAGSNVIDLNGVARLPTTYPSGPFNAAALLLDPLTTDLFVVRKDIVNGTSQIYVRPAPQVAGATKTLQFVVSVPNTAHGGDPVTAGDISPAGDQILLRPKNFSTRVDLWLWPWDPSETFTQALASDPCLVPGALEPVGTALGFAHDGNGYYSLSEGWHRPIYFYERLDVQNAPTVTITEPSDGAVVQWNDAVTFAATATDPDDGDVSASLDWTSNLDGDIASGPSFVTSTLSVGTHTITAAATNGLGAVVSDECTLIVNDPSVRGAGRRR